MPGKRGGCLDRSGHYAGQPSLASDLADVLLAVTEGDQQDIFQGCVREGANRLKLAQAVAEAFGYIRGVVREDTAMDKDVGHLGDRLSAVRESCLQVAQSQAKLNCTNMG